MANAQNDFQSLLAKLQPRGVAGTPMNGSTSNLNPQTSTPNRSTSFHQPMPHHVQQHGYQQPSVSSPLFSPPVNGGPQPHGSDILSPNTASTPQPSQQHNADITANLLNLLKFSQPPAGSAASSRPATGGGKSLVGSDGLEKPVAGTPSHARGISASDLVASFMGKPTMSGQPSPAPETVNEEQPANSESMTSDNAQEVLLQLLHRPKKTHQSNIHSILPTTEGPGEQPVETPSAAARDVSRSSPMRVFGQDSRETTPFEVPAPAAKVEPGIFTYVNPFEQLAASSPRNRTPQPTSSKNSPALEFLKQQTATPVGGNASSGKPDTQAMHQAPSTTSKTTETVSQALDELAEKVDKEVEDALASAEDDDEPSIKQEDISEDVIAAAADLDPEIIQALARGVKEELEKSENEGALEESMTPGTAKVVNDLINQAADGDVADSWESAEGEDNPVKEPERQVRVLNFPMKPFLGVTLKAGPSPEVQIRDGSVMDIARLKKEFDQLDRSLAAATSDYIAYALVKSGGMRIIRQDDGCDQSVFKTTGDRIFNISLCTCGTYGPSSKEQSVLGTGISGTVYWNAISHLENDLFDRDDLQSESLIFPPFPGTDENASGGQLKTRARTSSRHPEFFAIGRGKFIHIVFPQMARSPKYGVNGAERKVDTEKFFKERSLKITTGKAGKDFTFSEDDTVIASLDKTGRLRLWDIRNLVLTNAATAEKVVPVDVSTPLLTLSTTQPSERSWPTSVLFVDKLRPYSKNCAQRYIIVGLKQNHTIQLWDLGLGRAVQELHFPHENESDAICSIAYHPSTGIIVVGHPTRNSIYFIHLSAPRYGIPSMSQAQFVKRVAEKDATLPPPNSTACMSGLREISFASKGQLRSLELLSYKAPANAEPDADAPLFELYVMHSRGVTCLNFKKEDMGWSKESKVLYPVDAAAEGFVVLKDLPAYAQVEDEKSVAGESGLQTPIKKAKELVKKAEKSESINESSVEQESRAVSPVKAPVKKAEQPEMTKTEKKKKKKAEKAEKAEKEKREAEAAAEKAKEAAATLANGNASKPVEPIVPAVTKEPVKEEIKPTVSDSIPAPANVATATAPAGTAEAIRGSSETISLGISGDFLNKEMKKIEKSVSSEFNKVIARELESLHRRLDADRRVYDADAGAKQESILRLVSSTLTENVEKNLTRIVNHGIEKSVVPNIANVTSQIIDKKVSEVLTRQLQNAIPREVKSSLPEALNRVLNTKEFLTSISDLVATKVAVHVENEFSALLRSTITPALSNATNKAAEKIHSDMDNHVRKLNDRIKELEAARAADSRKMDDMTELLRGLSTTVATMATVQTEFQNTILEAQNDRRVNGKAASVASSSRQASSSIAPAVPAKTEYELEVDEINGLMQAGDVEDAVLKWLKSRSQTEIFDDVFARYETTFLKQLSPLVQLSVAAAVSASFDTNCEDRLVWLKALFPMVDLKDRDTAEVIPRLFDILIQRLDALYITIVESSRGRTVPLNERRLGLIYPLGQEARAIRNASVSH